MSTYESFLDNPTGSLGRPGQWNFVCPVGWKTIQQFGEGFALTEIGGGLRVIVDCTEKLDGNQWIHVSYSRKDWPPSHADTCKVKAAFIGERYAYAVFPPADKYVNIHPNCLHLWARLDGTPALPEFSEIVPGVGRSI